MRRRAFIAAGGGAVARQVVARGGDGFRRGLLLGVKRTSANRRHVRAIRALPLLLKRINHSGIPALRSPSYNRSR